MENISCDNQNVLVYIDNGNTSPGFNGKFVNCPLYETLLEGTLNTCVFKCHCVQSSCKEVYVRVFTSAFMANAKICEIRSCYSV